MYDNWDNAEEFFSSNYSSNSDDGFPTLIKNKNITYQDLKDATNIEKFTFLHKHAGIVEQNNEIKKRL
jgi:hypothetical protein